MSGLYSFRRSPEEVRKLFAYEEQAQFAPRERITPGGPMAIVRLEEGRRVLALVHWGFIPSWHRAARPSRPLANARAESVLNKPSFRNAMKYRRCLIPADGFFQRRSRAPGRGEMFHVHRPEHELFAIAGLWETWAGGDGSEIDTGLIITTPANQALSSIHGRMPAIITPADFAAWLNCEEVDASSAARLLLPAHDSYFVAEPLAPARTGAGQDQLKLL